MVRITKYIIIVDLKFQDKFLLVHGLFGFMAIITREQVNVIDRWLINGVNVLCSTEESHLYDYFLSKKYFLSNEEEEAFKNELLIKLKRRHAHQVLHPHTATFILSYRCNFICPYCFEQGIDRNSPIMNEKQVDSILKIYPEGELKHVGFYGGEPFLPENKEIISYIIKNTPNVEYSAVTNGYYLINYVPLFLGKKVRNIQVTFDGQESIHNKTRITKDGKQTFWPIFKGVKSAIEQKIPIKIRMNLSKKNVNDCYQFKEWITNYFNSSPYLTFDMQELFQYTIDDKAAISEIMVNESDIGKQNVVFESIPSIARFFYNGEPVHPIVNGCTSGVANRIYDPFGNIYSCYLGVGNKEKSVGTFFPELVYKTNTLLSRTADLIEKCKECKYIFLCGGGCANPIIDLYKDVMHPNCATMKHLIGYLIPQLYRKKLKREMKI